MIAKITKGMEVDSEEYIEAVKAIDAFLGSLPNVYQSSIGNLSTINKGLDALVD